MQFGYFDDTTREYVVERPDTPVSWTNYLGLEDFCTVISHNAGGYSFYKSAQHRRITRFRANALPLDRPGHYLYLRDNNDGDYWSASWQPVGKSLLEADYECRHGLSYSKYRCNYRDINVEQKIFIPRGDDLELWDVTIENLGDEEREISLFSYVEFSLHEVHLDSQDFQMGLYAAGAAYKNGIIEYDFFYGPDVYHYMTADFKPDSYDCVRDSFIGTYNDESNPDAVQNGVCSNSSELGGNHCGALQKAITLAPGEKRRVIFILGVGNSDAAVLARKKYSDHGNVDSAFADIISYWDKKCAIFNCETPDAGMNSMVNIWNLYQAETCVVWSRFASFIEVGGRTGLGYRDTSQDIMSIVHTNPTKAEERILQLLNGQTSSGFGLHLFDPAQLSGDGESGSVLPTVIVGDDNKLHIPSLEHVCADDVLWLVVSICEFVKEQGDLNFFDRVVPFADGGEDTVYNHLVKALEFSAEHVGKTGICKGLRADWNDCINLRGGETSMVSFMHYWALTAFTEAASALGKTADVENFQAMALKVKQACDANLWDGKWFLRGFTAQGRPIGTDRDAEGKIFLNAQSWAVMSGVADADRGRQSLDQVYDNLHSEYGLHLLAPAFSKPDDGIGFVTRVYKGVKENAAIFSHPAPWAVIAECQLGNGNRAFEYYSSMNPYNQNDKIEVRQAEPYSYCQFVMGRDHTAHGRARHPWLTGSAGWFYTAATRWILGIQITFDGLVINPSIPAEWPSFKVNRQWRGATFNIDVKNPNNVMSGVKELRLNGAIIDGAIPAQESGSVNSVEVVMG